MSNKFKFTQEDLDEMILKALGEKSANAEGKKPSKIQELLAKTKLGKKE
ncbi:MAG TPA: hypothetical protein VMY79_03140 [Dehalococcoidia bacterium]|nr:hypothetical protein [Dehalococcoidia bacterium]